MYKFQWFSSFLLLSYSEEATKVMVELLRTYSDENASEVKDDARNCVVSLLGRPNVLIMDFLLALPPVAALQGEPIYQVHMYTRFVRVMGKLESHEIQKFLGSHAVSNFIFQAWEVMEFNCLSWKAMENLSCVSQVSYYRFQSEDNVR